VTFRLLACRFELRARRVIRFPRGLAGNVLRGALGKGLRESAHAHIFEPGAAPRSPSGLANPPRPFVFRCSELNGRVVPTGEHFCFGLHIFDDSLDPLTRALAGWADVISVQQQPVAIPLNPLPHPVHQIRVDFQTPTELKNASPQDFSALTSRVRDRISTLSALYGSGPLEIDFRALADRAASIETTRSELHHVSVYRRSRGTGQTHPIGGLVGFAEYAGSLAEFIPYLNAAHWTGVGRHCTWGNGQITTTILDSAF
jgi:CRISPR-associated endoribonuclease Cas6